MARLCIRYLWQGISGHMSCHCSFQFNVNNFISLHFLAKFLQKNCKGTCIQNFFILNLYIELFNLFNFCGNFYTWIKMMKHIREYIIIIKIGCARTPYSPHPQRKSRNIISSSWSFSQSTLFCVLTYNKLMSKIVLLSIKFLLWSPLLIKHWLMMIMKNNILIRTVYTWHSRA